LPAAAAAAAAVAGERGGESNLDERTKEDRGPRGTLLFGLQTLAASLQLECGRIICFRVIFNAGKKCEGKKNRDQREERATQDRLEWFLGENPFARSCIARIRVLRIVLSKAS